MKYNVKRYNFDKQYICDGELYVNGEGQNFTLKYIDHEIEIVITEPYHAIAPLIKLRKILEDNYQSLIGINGCRKDVSRRFTAHARQYILNKEEGLPKMIHMFEPTNEIDKLCKDIEHEKAYHEWNNSKV